MCVCVCVESGGGREPCTNGRGVYRDHGESLCKTSRCSFVSSCGPLGRAPPPTKKCLERGKHRGLSLARLLRVLKSPARASRPSLPLLPCCTIVGRGCTNEDLAYSHCSKIAPHGKTGLNQGGGLAVCCTIFRIFVCTSPVNNSIVRRRAQGRFARLSSCC